MADLIIILGNPASGKSTLARRLCAELALPCLGKDDVKEALFDTLGSLPVARGARERSKRYSEASFAALLRLARTQLDNGVSCVLEGNWRAQHAAALRSVANGAEVRTAQIMCCVTALELARRFKSRLRHPGHLDAGVEREQIDAWSTQPPAFMDLPGPRWTYDGGAPTSYGQVVLDLNRWRL